MSIFSAVTYFLVLYLIVYANLCRVWDLDGNENCIFRLRSPGISVCWHPEEVFKVGGSSSSWYMVRVGTWVCWLGWGNELHLQLVMYLADTLIQSYLQRRINIIKHVVPMGVQPLDSPLSDSKVSGVAPTGSKKYQKPWLVNFLDFVWKKILNKHRKNPVTLVYDHWSDLVLNLCALTNLRLTDPSFNFPRDSTHQSGKSHALDLFISFILRRNLFLAVGKDRAE